MCTDRKPSEMLNKLYEYPDNDKKTNNRNELQEKPNSFQLHFFHHAPGVIKRNESFPAGDACFLKHAIQAD